LSNVGFLSTFAFYLLTQPQPAFRLSTRATKRISFFIGTFGAIGFGVDSLINVGFLSGSEAYFVRIGAYEDIGLSAS
jgi:hypothetical protein